MSDFDQYTQGGAVSSYPVEKMHLAPTMKQRIDMAVQQAEERLKAAQRARTIFDQHPELEELINILNRGGF